LASTFKKFFLSTTISKESYYSIKILCRKYTRHQTRPYFFSNLGTETICHIILRQRLPTDSTPQPDLKRAPCVPSIKVLSFYDKCQRMESKGYFIAILCLVGGVIGGYLVGSMNLQNQILTYELRLQSKDAELSSKDTQLQAKDTMIQTLTKMIDSQDVLLQELKANVTKLQEQIESLESQSTQAQTQIRIDTVTWSSSAPTFKLLIRNTGSVAATIESVSIRPNTAGSTATTYKPQNPAAIQVGVTLNTGTVTFTSSLSYKWFVSNSYVIRVVTTTGFYYEMVATTPATGAPP